MGVSDLTAGIEGWFRLMQRGLAGNLAGSDFVLLPNFPRAYHRCLVGPDLRLCSAAYSRKPEEASGRTSAEHTGIYVDPSQYVLGELEDNKIRE